MPAVAGVTGGSLGCVRISFVRGCSNTAPSCAVCCRGTRYRSFVPMWIHSNSDNGVGSEPSCLCMSTWWEQGRSE